MIKEVIKDYVGDFIEDINEGCIVMKDDAVQEYILNTSLEEIKEIEEIVVEKIIKEDEVINNIEDIIKKEIDKHLYETIRERVDKNIKDVTIKCEHCGEIIINIEEAIKCVWEEYNIEWYYCKRCDNGINKK